MKKVRKISKSIMHIKHIIKVRKTQGIKRIQETEYERRARFK